MNRHWLVVILMLIHLGITFYVSSEIFAGIPHMPDSAAYYRHAVLLTHGRLYQGNITIEPMEAFVLMGTHIRDGIVYNSYPHFWPFLIAIFIKLHAPSLLSPLLSALSLLLIFLIARKLFDEKTALIAALLYCVSPFVILMAGEYMMHMPAQFFLLVAFYCLIRYADSSGVCPALLGGLSLGYAFALRPLTTIGVFLPIGIYFLIFYRKKLFVWRSLCFIAGFAVIFILLLADNRLLTGDFLTLGHPTAMYRDERSLVSPFNLHNGLNQTDSTLAFLSPIIFYSFIPHIILAFTALPLFFLRRKQDFLCLSIFLSLAGFYAMTYTHGIHGYGPRYFFESFFALFILAAQGTVWLLGRFAGWKKRLVVVIFLFLLVYNVYGLVTILPKYENYNFIRTDMHEKIRALDLENSILIIGKTWDWFEDGVTAVFFDPEYEKSFIIRELENKGHLKVLEKYPEKKAYIVKNRFTLEEFGRQSINGTANS
jgi:4-amino-4-deoxy-L-arabinose transferase-like glycosyltransferase